jgi:hypothetical protein
MLSLDDENILGRVGVESVRSAVMADDIEGLLNRIESVFAETEPVASGSK